MSEKERNDAKKGEEKHRGKRIFLRTFGCQMNTRDSELVAGMLKEKGFEFVDSIEEANLVLFNTCSVRQHAEDRVAGNLQSLIARKEKDPDFRIGVIGCMAKRHAERLFEEYPHIDLVVGPGNIYELSELVNKLDESKKILAVKNNKRPRKNVNVDFREGTFSAFVNIMTGCNNFCSYCIVPHVRGREVSRFKNDIVKEVKILVDKGVKEITLLGQNVNSYGKGLNNKITFPELLEAVNEVKGIKRIRFTTSHPKDADKSLFRAMAELDKVCESLHLPLQSGSDKMLDLMNRKYKYEDYKKKIELLRKMIPDAGLSTDIIVGFPSEKELDFNATKKALEESSYNSAFIFKYSPRPPAASSFLVDDVSEQEKRDRNTELLELQKIISTEKHKALIGTTQEILVEGKSRMSEEEVVGRTRSNVSCVFAGNVDLTGELVNVKIINSSPYTLKGEMLEKVPQDTESLREKIVVVKVSDNAERRKRGRRRNRRNRRKIIHRMFTTL